MQCVSQGQILDNFTCYHTDIEVPDQTCYLTQFTDMGPASPAIEPIMPGPDRVATRIPMFKPLM